MCGLSEYDLTIIISLLALPATAGRAIRSKSSLRCVMLIATPYNRWCLIVWLRDASRNCAAGFSTSWPQCGTAIPNAVNRQRSRLRIINKSPHLLKKQYLFILTFTGITLKILPLRFAENFQE